MESFLAIDFETANNYRESACAVGLVRVELGKVVEGFSRLIKPPSRWFVYTALHGIEWEDVKNEPTFGEIWSDLKPMFKGVKFLAAHNASFDESVLSACCYQYDIPIPKQPFRCTMRAARDIWNIRPTKLPDVCERLKIKLNHHDAYSDALACAKIMIKVQKALK